MRTKATPTARPTLPLVRCAIYTRKSTEEGLEQEFNSLDAQRESGEAFVASQQGEGWKCLPDRYDDGGFSGGNMDRPALARLMADIEAGKIDCVVVYKVDRLSRSLLDFARMMSAFDDHKVSFVSVTQQFNTATSMGRLVLNVLLSFAQFEREIISERTRDKIAATRRKGKWSGGHPILGYDIDRERSRLLLNEDEAVRVRAVFELYLEHESLLPVVQELAHRGWTSKQWQTGGGKERGGVPFTKTSLHRLLTNVAYIGKVKHKEAVYEGEHPALIDPAIWQKVQTLLAHNGKSSGGSVRNQFGALLKGLLHCTPCGCAMTPSHTTRKDKRYRYYVCSKAQQHGWDTCPSKSVPAQQIEDFVVAQIRCVGRDPALVQETVAQVRRQDQERLAELEAERRTLERDLNRWNADLARLSREVGVSANPGSVITKLADLQDRIAMAERRLAGVREQVLVTRRGLVHEDEVTLALGQFDPVWQALSPREQARLIGLLVERVDYDGGKGTLSVTFHAAGIKTLADELAARQEVQIA